MFENFGFELSVWLILAGLVFLIIRNVRKDKADGRGLIGGPKKPTPPKRKK